MVFQMLQNTNFCAAKISAAQNATCSDKIRYVKNTRKNRVRKQRIYGKNRAKNSKNGAFLVLFENRDWNYMAFKDIPKMLPYKTGLKRPENRFRKKSHFWRNFFYLLPLSKCSTWNKNTWFCKTLFFGPHTFLFSQSYVKFGFAVFSINSPDSI